MNFCDRNNMKKQLIKYPPQASEVCEYDVTSKHRWDAETNAQHREKMRPFAGPYFDGEGWMLNAVMVDLREANIALVSGKFRDEVGNMRDGIVVYRAQSEMLGDFADER